MDVACSGEAFLHYCISGEGEVSQDYIFFSCAVGYRYVVCQLQGILGTRFQISVDVAADAEF